MEKKMHSDQTRKKMKTKKEEYCNWKKITRIINKKTHRDKQMDGKFC